MKPPNSSTSWLWWTALLIAAGAGAVSYIIKKDPGYLEPDKTIGTIVMFSVIAIGLCIISATAHWWMRR